MKTINQDDLFQNLNDFLKSKGVELKDGAYSERVRKSCGVLTDVINATQTTVKRAKAEVDKKLDQLRQSIHQATAPTPPPASPAPEPPASAAPSPEPATPAAPVPRPPAARKSVTARTKPKTRRKPSATRAKVRRRK